MAHELDIDTVTGKVSMMYHGEVPWHGLGTALDHPATAEEAAELSGQNFTVEKRQLYVKKPMPGIPGQDLFSEVDGKYATIRTDRNTVLGIVSGYYQPIQNSECFSFFDGIVGEGKAIYHTAGVLRGGRETWLLAKLPEEYDVVPGDRVEQYVLLSNAHDGTRAERAKLTNTRVVCANTLSAAFGGHGLESRIWHTGNIKQQFKHAAEVLGFAQKAAEHTKLAYATLAGKMLGVGDVDGYFQALVPDNPQADRNTRTQNIRAAMLHLFENGRGSQLGRGTAWNLYNSVTEYTTHVRLGRSAPDRRLHSLWFGGGEDLSQRALSAAMALAVA